MAFQSQSLTSSTEADTKSGSCPSTSLVAQILQVPTLELRSNILEELQTNPLLEEIGSNDESLDSNEVEPSPDEVQDQDAEEFPENSENLKDSRILGRI